MNEIRQEYAKTCTLKLSGGSMGRSALLCPVSICSPVLDGWPAEVLSPAFLQRLMGYTGSQDCDNNRSSVKRGEWKPHCQHILIVQCETAHSALVPMLVQNSSARIITRTPLHHNVTPILQQLHRLPVQELITKSLSHIFKVTYNLCPPYLSAITHHTFLFPVVFILPSPDCSLTSLQHHGRQGFQLLCPQTLELSSTRFEKRNPYPYSNPNSRRVCSGHHIVRTSLPFFLPSVFIFFYLFYLYSDLESPERHIFKSDVLYYREEVSIWEEVGYLAKIPSG